MKKYFLFIIMFFLAYLASAQQSQGFFIDDWVAKNAELPQNIVKEKSENSPDIIVSIDAADTLSKISPYVFGNNANTYSTIMYDNPGLVNHLRDLSPNVLRYPGGNLSNVFFWDLEPGNQPADMPQSVIDDHGLWAGRNSDTWTMSVDNYYRFLDSVRSTGIICVNYSYARYGTSDDPVAKAAHYAADWVRYDNGRTKFWEIGNENFGNWQSGYTIDTNLNKDGQPEKINGQLYGEHCLVFIDSMRAAAAEGGHTIYIGVQAWESETSWDPVQTDWNELMMPVVGNKPDFYILHNYYTPYDQDSDAQTILNTYKQSEEFKTSVYNDLTDAGLGPATLSLTEWNIFAVGSKQMVSHINGIHSVLVTGKLMEDEYGLATRWDLANGWNDGNDHGTFSRGGEPGADPFDPRPEYYYRTFMQRYTGDVMVGTDSDDENIVVFASEFNNGPLGVVVVNKGTTVKTVALNTSNFFPGTNYYWYTLVGGEMDGEFSRQVVINGQGPDGVAGGPDNYNAIKAYSAENDGGIRIDAPAYSVNYILIDGARQPPASNYQVSFQVNGIGGGDPYPLANAVVAAGNNTFVTNNQGQVAATLSKGDYNLDIYKSGYISQQSELTIEKDTTLTFTLQEESYEVEFVVKEETSETLVEGCELTIGEETLVTGSNGIALFSGLPSEFTLGFSKQHYTYDGAVEFQISSDTAITLYVKKIQYTVQIRVNDIYSGSGIWGIAIDIGGQSIATNSQGVAYILLENGIYLLKIDDSDYSAVEKNIEIISDTTFIYQLEPLYAYLKFRLKEGTTPVNNAQIVVLDDTLYSSSTGIATFRDLSTGADYPYKITKEGYKTIEDIVSLRIDTTLNIQMEKATGIASVNQLSDVLVWPNPVTTEIYFSGLLVSEEYSASILNMQGMEISKIKGVANSENIVKTGMLPEGMYLLKIISGESFYTFLFIKE